LGANRSSGLKYRKTAWHGAPEIVSRERSLDFVAGEDLTRLQLFLCHDHRLAGDNCPVIWSHSTPSGLPICEGRGDQDRTLHAVMMTKRC
jgi:hypothetical protein